METSPECLAALWYEFAARCHLEKHQGCAWCGGSYCVFRSVRPERVEFSCSVCDFFACFNHQTGHFYSALGRPAVPAAG